MSSNTILPAGTLVTQEYVDQKFAELKTYLDANLSSGGGGGTPIPDPEPEPLPKCKRGPVIEAVRQATLTVLEVQFDGEDVFEMSVSVKVVNTDEELAISVINGQTGKQLGTRESFKPDTSRPHVTIKGSLIKGTNYSVTLTGLSCKGSHVFFFVNQK